jgi:hypothetical protein
VGADLEFGDAARKLPSRCRELADRLVDQAVRFCGRLLGRDERDLAGIAGGEAEAAAGKLAGLVIQAVDLIADLGFDPDETNRARWGPWRPPRRRASPHRSPGPDVADGMKECATIPVPPDLEPTARPPYERINAGLTTLLGAAGGTVTEGFPGSRPRVAPWRNSPSEPPCVTHQYP